ncbi:MAG: hypothetical protein ABIK93_01670 [candidate division WOR-3 bacterium]
MQQETEATIAKFGKIIGIILFFIAGWVLIFSLAVGPLIGERMFSFPFRSFRGMGMSQAAIEDIYEEIEELEDEVEDLGKRIDEMPVFIQDLVKHNLERMKK